MLTNNNIDHITICNLHSPAISLIPRLLYKLNPWYLEHLLSTYGQSKKSPLYVTMTCGRSSCTWLKKKKKKKKKEKSHKLRQIETNYNVIHSKCNFCSASILYSNLFYHFAVFYYVMLSPVYGAKVQKFLFLSVTWWTSSGGLPRWVRWSRWRDLGEGKNSKKTILQKAKKSWKQ